VSRVDSAGSVAADTTMRPRGTASNVQEMSRPAATSTTATPESSSTMPTASTGLHASPLGSRSGPSPVIATA
jgi:hypothetical protein